MFKKPIIDRRTVERSRHYLQRVTDATGNGVEFPVPIRKDESIRFYFADIPSSKNAMAYIRVAHARVRSKEPRPRIFINGEEVPSVNERIPGGGRNDNSMYFGVFVIPVGVLILNSNPSPYVDVLYPDSSGYVSTVTIEVDECSGGSCCLLGGRASPFACPEPANDPRDQPRTIPETGQRLKNPSFEKGSDDWELSGGASISTTSAYWGGSSLRLGQETAEAMQVIYLKANLGYRLVCHVRGSVNFYIRKQSNLFLMLVDEEGPSTAIDGSTWRLKQMDFYSTDKDIYELTLSTTASQAGSADACTLYPQSLVPTFVGDAAQSTPIPVSNWKPPNDPSTVGEQLIDNPSFEDLAPAKWSLKGTAAFYESNALEGTMSMRLPMGDAEASERAPLEKGRNYRYRCYLVEGGDLDLVVRSSRGETVASNTANWVTPVVGTDWAYKQVIFEAPKNGPHEFAILNGDLESALVDYCTVFETTESVETPTPTMGPEPTEVTTSLGPQLLLDPGFEKASRPDWVYTGNARIETNTVFEGSRSLRLPPGIGSASQSLQLEKDGTYRIRCIVLNNSPFIISVARELTGEIVVSDNRNWNQLTTRWGERIVEFEARNNGLHIVSLSNGRDDSAFIDFCTLNEVNPEATQSPGPTELPTALPPAQILADPSFELNTQGNWVVENGYFDPDVVLDGFFSLRLRVGQNSATQVVSLTELYEYTLECRVRRNLPLIMELIVAPLLLDPDFEKGTKGPWVFSGSARVETSLVRSGARSVRLPTRSVSRVKQEAALRRNRQFLLTCFVSNNRELIMSVDVNGEEIARNESDPSDSGPVWTKRTLLFTTLRQGVYEINLFTEFSSFAVVDDCSLEETVFIPTDTPRPTPSQTSSPTPELTPTPSPLPEIPNGSLQLFLAPGFGPGGGSERWVLEGAARYDTIRNFEGSRSCKLDFDTSSVSQEVELLKGATYAIRVMVYGPGVLMISVSDGSGVVFQEKSQNRIAPSWQEHGMSFVTDSRATYKVSFGSSRGHLVYVDQAQVFEVDVPEPTDSPTPEPTDPPTAVPTEPPTALPTEPPTAMPTEPPTAVPTDLPTAVPTIPPTPMQTDSPTPVPTELSTPRPTNPPTTSPSEGTPSPTATLSPSEKPVPTTPVVDGQILVNAGFDDGKPAPWNFIGSAVIDSLTVYQGTHSLRLRIGMSEAQQRVVLEAGGEYSLSCVFLKRTSVFMRIIQNGVVMVITDRRTESLDTRWEKRTLHFTAPDDGNYIVSVKTERASWTYVDSCAM
ncbi:hypothetical protein NDN08_007294 [Rhodosorus marinus]|uniref:Beta-porphyranase A C-terminal domain-containing protein n=1 Tax=Rhodosorus marinus TaxID=101924 RepID=A0AAV8UK54_9RHOD|nr:hypothetical protein NDN08_007294 [Rhodosorus marinus]